jgi:MFS family permease
MIRPDKGTVFKYHLKQLGLNLAFTIVNYNISFFGTQLPYVVEKLLGIEYASHEYYVFYDVCYVLFSFTFAFGGFIGGMLLHRRRRVPFLLAIDALLFLNSLLYFFPSIFTFVMARFLSGLLNGLLSSMSYLLISELILKETSGSLFGDITVGYGLGSLLSSLVSYFVETDWGWTLAICLIGLMSFLHAAIILIFFRKESPIYLLLVENDEQACRESLHFLLSKPELEMEMLERLKAEKEIRKEEPSVWGVLRSKRTRKRNLKGMLLYCGYELVGMGTLTSNWTEIGYLLLGSALESVQSIQVKVFVTCMTLSRIFLQLSSGVTLNRVRRKPFMAIVLFLMAAGYLYVYLGLSIFDSNVLWAGIIPIYCTFVITTGSVVVAGEMSSRQVFSFSAGVLRTVTLIYSLVYTLFGAQILFLVFSTFGFIYFGFYLSIYDDSFGKSLAEIEREEKEKEGYAPV